MDGIEATRAISARHPGVGVIALTTYADDASVLGALRARGPRLPHEGRRAGTSAVAIHTVAGGEAALDPRSSTTSSRRSRAQAETAPLRDGAELPDGLTPREAEVLA